MTQFPKNQFVKTLTTPRLFSFFSVFLFLFLSFLVGVFAPANLFAQEGNWANRLTVSRSGTGSGTVTAWGGLNCGSVCEVDYFSGVNVELTATPAPGSTFIGWSGDCIISGTTCTAVMNGNQAVTATFNGIPASTKFKINDRVQTTTSLNVRESAGTSATVLGTQPSGALGVVIGGPIFADGVWWRQVNYDSGADGWSVENFLAAYTPPSLFSLSVSKDGTGSGTVTGSNATINCGTTCSVSLNSGTSVTLTATPSTGSTFAGWSGACTGTFSTCTLTMSASVMATATFNTTTSQSPTSQTIPLSTRFDHFFSVPSGQSLTLGDLSDFPSSPSVLSHTHEVLGFSQSPPTSFDSPSTTFYKLNGQWYKVGAPSTPLPSTTPISPYFIVRSRATTVTTISVPSYVTYYGATVMNPPVRPWAYTLLPGKTYYFKLPGGPQLLTALDSYVKDGTGFVKGGSTSADQIQSPIYANNTIGYATYYYRLLTGQTNTGWRSVSDSITVAVSTPNNYIVIGKTLTNGRTSDWMPPPGTIYYGDSSATGNPNGVRWLADFKTDYPAPLCYVGVTLKETKNGDSSTFTFLAATITSEDASPLVNQYYAEEPSPFRVETLDSYRTPTGKYELWSGRYIIAETFSNPPQGELIELPDAMIDLFLPLDRNVRSLNIFQGTSTTPISSVPLDESILVCVARS